MNKLLADIEPNGLVRQGKAFVSPNYEHATRRLDLDLTTTAGNVVVKWIGDDNNDGDDT